LELANRLGEVVGSYGKWIFLIGFWGAVFTSMFGVWQGVPYIFADYIQIHQMKNKIKIAVSTDSIYYRSYLLYMAFPPMLILLFGKPVWIVMIYSIVGAFFLPFLAGMLLYMNNRREWVNELNNGLLINIILWVSLILFGYLCLTEIFDLF